MTIEQIIKKFENKPSYLTNGAGLLSKTWGVNRGDIYEAKRIIRNKNKYGTEYHPDDVAFIHKDKLPRILLFDLETSPIISYTWGVKKQFIQPEQIIRDWTILTFAAKWLNEDKIIDGTAKDEEDFDDFNLCSDL